MEALAAAAICAVHLSRLAEEIVLWCTAQFGFVTLSDRFTTGSSIMPQKRNPDAAELVRAKSGRVIGALTALFVVMKALPLAYSKDMQEDKEQVFDALPNLSLSLAAMAGLVADMAPDRAAMRTAAEAGYSTATDLADWLVREAKLPFRQAHHVTGRIVAAAAARGVSLAALPLEIMQAEHPAIGAAVFDVLTIDASVASRRSEGGTAPDNVRAAARGWIERLKGAREPVP
jgi:argininosuccinate lyase